jgi:hypothetical protein
MDNVSVNFYAIILIDCFALIINFNSHLYFQAQGADVAAMQPDIVLVLPHPVHDLTSMCALDMRLRVGNRVALEMVNSIFRLIQLP